MLLNPRIKSIFASFNIPIADGYAYLLSIYYDVKPSYTPVELVEKIKRTRILVFDEQSKTLNWIIPLFEEQVIGFEWVKDWIDKFEAINKDRKGTYKSVAARMKTFFVNNPSIRQDDVMGATDLYLRTIINPTYLKTSHKFIYEGVGAEKISHLLEWIEKYKSMVVSDTGRSAHNNTMM